MRRDRDYTGWSERAFINEIDALSSSQAIAVMERNHWEKRALDAEQRVKELKMENDRYYDMYVNLETD